MTSENKVLDEIAAERREQLDKHGWTPKYDDEHEQGELAMAAACYATPHRLYRKEDYAEGTHFIDPWPLSTEYDKRPYNGNMVRGNTTKGEKHRRALLVKAAALIVAEIERMDRRKESAR